MRGNVKALVDGLAASIVKAELHERKLHIEDFSRSCEPRMVNARTAVIKRLYAEGFSCYYIARLLNMTEKTVQSRFNPKMRTNRNAARLELYYKRKAERAA